MIVILTGSTGLVGESLTKTLLEKNYTIHFLNRKPKKLESSHCKSFIWPEANKDFHPKLFPKNSDYGIVHLTGEPISQWPWTKKVKAKIYSSRIESTKKLVEALKKQTHPPQFFLCANAIGIYGNQNDKDLTEASPTPNQNLFLQKVCKDWQEEALKISSICRVCVFRFGLILSHKKGFLYEQEKLLKRGCFIRFTVQKSHWFSWISLEDVSRLILWAIENKKSNGIYNAVSPNPIPLKQFYKILTEQTKHKVLSLPFPLFLMKLLGGEIVKNLLMNSKVYPTKALNEAFVFQKAKLEEALK